ncbi:transcriptional regulator ATRX homolog [Hylaeus anthracinus]|uniref:transcriptional regulator ATRX homolog n=1 Tax=Hylaeus anthracinus TaxID=313031 RepID=UPI0023B92879|nr:transcriptional regulator ATRX homolog [Hylaeus anthracinus]
MKFKTYTGITWSILELTGLLEDEDSHVYFEKFKKHFGLHPFHLTNLNAALNEILSSNLNSYDDELKGFLLAYKNPKLLTPLGDIFYDTCFIHVDIEADFYIFRPEVGCSLKGIVNKKGLDHIGVLVHKAFNVSIPKLDDEENWPGDNLEIGQEVRFKVTLLDFSSKLPFIRGTLNPDDYLRGCKLTEKTPNRRLSSNNNSHNNKDDDESISNKELKTIAKNNKRHTFFATDSEHSSDDDVPEIKKEVSDKKKSKKKIEKEKIIEHIDVKKEDQKRAKKSEETKKSKRKSIKTETVQEQHLNNSSINGKFEDIEELEESTTIKKKAKKKSNTFSSQSSMDEGNNEKSVKSPLKISNNVSNMESKNRVSKIKLEQDSESSTSEQIVRENMSESKISLKKNSTKRKHADETDNSADDFTVNKYIKSSSKKISKTRTSDIDNTEPLIDIKTEKLNEVNVKTEDAPTQKQHRKRKHSVKAEVSESDTSIRKPEKTPVKRRSKTSSISESEFVFPHMQIKTEKVNSEDENHVKTKKVLKKDSDLNISTCSSNYDAEEDANDNTIKKKRKKRSKKNLLDISEIKVEPEFDYSVVKEEVSDTATNNDATENIRENYDTDSSNRNSPKKKHKFNLNTVISDDEEGLRNNRKLKVKAEKLITNVTSDDDERDSDDEKQKKHSKKSPSKQLNKPRKSNSEFDFSKVKVKCERSSDS